MITINGLIKELEYKSYTSKNNQQIQYKSCKVIFDGADYPVYVSVRCDDDLTKYKIGAEYKFKLDIQAYNYKPIYKYTILEEVKL